MLRINQNSHAGGAKSYYTSADYYTEGQELTGNWRGQAAAMLGLKGEIAKADWDAMCDQLHPRTDEELFQRRRPNRTIGYDFNFHVPKSVSALYALTSDDRILAAFKESVDSTMQDVEAEMQTRVRKDGRNEDRHTGNMVWGEFVHLTSRPVDGVPDPHLHAHCFVHNVTWDNQEQAWKAGQFRGLVRDAPYFEAMFHARLSRKLADLGLPIERTKKGWEIEGVPRSVVEKFSRRTAEIDQKARELGIEDAEAKAELGAKTRLHKAKDLTMPELRAEWRSRLSADEQDALARVEKHLGGDARPNEDGAAMIAVDYSIAHEFERKSVVPERILLATALKQAVGQATADEVRRMFDAKGLLIHERQGRRMATTLDVLDEESRIIAFARSGRGTCRQLGRRGGRIKRDWLNASQQAAVNHVLDSRDRVMMIRGAAGVGKTSLMQEAVEAIEENGTRVLAFAPTADASRNVLREAGFQDADTVARLLKDEALQRQAAGQLIWIDEAGLLGAKTMAQVFDLAERIDARVLLTGDKRQHGSVERGAMLRLLETEAGVTTAEVKEIQRQRDRYKKAMEALSEGKTEEGFDRLDELGWIKEIPDADRYRQLAADYVDAVAHGKTALVVSPTHAEGGRITAEIRRSLQKQDLLGSDSRRFPMLQNAQLTEAERRDAVNFHAGDVLQFHQNAKGYQRGQRVEVNGQPLPLAHADRFSLFHASSLELAPGDVVRITHNGFTLDGQHRLNNGALYRVHHFDDGGNLVLSNGWTVDKNYGHLAHGYVVTSHASQGKTVDRVFVGQSSQSGLASSKEQFYVSCSRGRESVAVYCDDKDTLREAVEQSDERVTATELLRGDRIRAVVDLQRRYEEIARPPEIEFHRMHGRDQTLREPVHER
jgi:conjugative relaxase-like TrwC/TraI family protein